MVEKMPDTTVLFFNTGAADREAYLSVKASGMPCEFRAPTEEDPTPLLLVGYRRIIGVDEIKAFVEEHRGQAGGMETG